MTLAGLRRPVYKVLYSNHFSKLHIEVTHSLLPSLETVSFRNWLSFCFLLLFF